MAIVVAIAVSAAITTDALRADILAPRNEGVGANTITVAATIFLSWPKGILLLLGARSIMRNWRATCSCNLTCHIVPFRADFGTSAI